MRRLVALVMLAVVGAAIFGLSSASSGLSVNGTTVSGSTLRSELSAISASTTLQCYLASLEPATYGAGAGASVAASGAAAWANLRIEGVAIDQYARTSLKFRPTATTLAEAQQSLESDLTQAATSRQYSCPGTSAQALAAMTPEMRSFEIESQAASLDLVNRLDTTVPLTTASAKNYYASHTSDYDTICVSLAVVAPKDVTAFNAAQRDGATVAELAKRFSADPSGAKGGAYGCFGPTSSSFAGVRDDTIATALDTFPTTPQYIDYNNSRDALFVAPTKRTVTPFAQAEAAVLSDLESANASAANTEKEKILYYSAISVDPAFGRWGLNTTGPSVFAPATPSTTDVGGASTVKALTSAASAS